MALIKCKECGREMSSTAKACPACGAEHLSALGQTPPVIQPITRRGGAKSPTFWVQASKNQKILICCIFVTGIIGIMISVNINTPAPTSKSTTTASQFSSAPSPSGFRNFNWGDSPTGKLKMMTSPSDTPDGTSMYVPPDGTKPEPLFDIPVAEEAFMFSSQGRFYSGSAWLDGRDNFDKMKTELTRRFGEPSFANLSVSFWTWKWQDKPIEVSLSYQEQFARTTVTFETKQY